MAGQWERSTKGPEFGQRCIYLKHVPTREECLACPRPQCVHDRQDMKASDGRHQNMGRPRSGGKAGASVKGVTRGLLPE